MSLDNSTRIVWPWEPELGVKDIFGGIPTLPSLSDFSVDIYLYISCLIIILSIKASVNTCLLFIIH